MEKLTRTWSLDSTAVKRNEENSEVVFAGHASVFNQPTLIGSARAGMGFIEEIAPGAFDDVLQDDVRLLINHEGLPLARTTNGTMIIRPDEIGLYNEARLANTTISRDIVTLLERGDVNHQSFAFSLSQDGVEWGKQELNGEMMDHRIITKVSRLYDTSIVTFPAYEGATGGLRSIAASDDDIVEALRELRSEEEIERLLKEENVAKVARVESLLRKHMTWGKLLRVNS